MQHQVITASDVLKTVHVIASTEDIELCIAHASGALSRTSPEEVLAAALLEQVLAKEDLVPLHSPQITLSPPREGQHFSFSACFEVLPHIPVPLNPEALSITLPEPEPRASDLTRVSARYIKRLSSLEPVQEHRAPRVGDVVCVDVEATCQEQMVAGMCHKDFRYRMLGLDALGMGQSLDSLLQSLYPGQRGTLRMPCPADYPDATVQGKDIILSVTLKELFTEQHPVIDDALCRSMGFKGLADFNLHIYKTARAERTQELEAEAKESLLQGLLRPLDFPLPQCLVTRSLQEHMQLTAASLEARGMDRHSITAQMQAQGAALMEQARQQAQRHAFLLALAQFYGLEVSQESMDKAVQRMAAATQSDAGSLRQQLEESGQWQEIEMRLLLSESLNFLYRKAQKVFKPSTAKAS